MKTTLIDHVSHSMIAAFDCPRRGWRIYINGERDQTTTTMTLFLGSTFHRFMESVFSFECWNRRTVIAYWPRFFKDELKGQGEWKKQLTLDAIDQASYDGQEMVRNVFEKHQDLLRSPYKDAKGPWIEKDFKFKVREDCDVPATGYVDLALPGKDGLVIVDWKTSKYLPKPVKEEDRAMTTYEDQLQLYASAAESKGVRVEELRLIFPRLGKVVSYVPTAEMKERQTERVVKVVERLSSYEKAGANDVDRFFVFSGAVEVCRWCQFKNGCPGYVPEPVPEPKP